MNDFIFSVQPQPPGILFGQPWDSFLPPLVGSFLGVFLGFLINYTYQMYKDCKTKNYYKNVIHGEIGQCITTLKRKPDYSKTMENFHVGLPAVNGELRNGMILPWPNSGIVLLPIDRWTSIVNSGYLRFFKVDEVDKLSQAYNNIKNYNYEVNRTLNYEVNAKQHPYEEIPYIAYSSSVDNLQNDGRKLLEQLQKINEETWFEPNHWWNFWK